MAAVVRTDDGRLVLDAPAWSLVQRRAGRPFLDLLDDAGTRWAVLAAIGAVDTLEGPDEWWAVDEPVVAAAEGNPGVVIVTWRVRSARWEACRLVLCAADDRLAVCIEVVGKGRLTDVRLLGGRGSAWQGMDSGRWWSGRGFESLVSGNPDSPRRIVAPAGESTASGVVGSGSPAGGRWFFTPGPLAFAAAREAAPDPLQVPDGPWLGIGVAATDVAEVPFTQVAWEADDIGFDIRMDYEGHTVVDGRWTSPWVVLVPGQPDPYAALAAPSPPAIVVASSDADTVGHVMDDIDGMTGWWREPMFCGWGAQWALSAEVDEPPAALAAQAHYDRWLARLAAGGVHPGTIVIDDKWQLAYGTNEPDPSRWPDLAAWIADRHDADVRVLLWWKAWDPEGLPPEWCIRDGAGRPVAADPTNPAYVTALDASIRRLFRSPGAGGLGADGLKIDFTASTPSGAGLRTWAEEHGPRGDAHPWGIALLHRLLEIVAGAARAERPDALLVTHTPNALFADVVSMIRLNDALRLEDPEPHVPVVAQLRHRAAVVRAAMPGVPIDTDDWAMPSLDEWRAWQRAKPLEGVPALYHVEGLGTVDERLADGDLRLVAREWAMYRERVGLPQRREAG
ncbi:MAG TPA: hypothetical protein VKB30_08465 [Candidatus Limnocylindrales bacterium]|nr:hypothetical protein [Candidatus Limnocylindrales bacterium]